MQRHSILPDGSNQFFWPEARFFGTFEFENMLLQAEAIGHELQTCRYSPTFFDARKPGKEPKLGFWMNGSNLTSRWATLVCNNKHLTNVVLAEQGVPVPRGRAFPHNAVQPAMAYAKSLNGPFVLKPLAGGGGRAVSVGLNGRDDFIRAHKLLNPAEDFRVEQHVNGRDHRVLVCDGEVYSVLIRVPANVIGDGVSNVRQLVEAKNEFRRKNPRYIHSLMSLDDKSVADQLEKQGLSPDSVPNDGQRVAICEAANISQGGESYEVMHETHPSILEFSKSVDRAIGGLGHCGIDLLLNDHTKPLDSQEHAICEVNSHAEMGVHCFPTSGEPIYVIAKCFQTIARRSGLDLAAKTESTRVVLKANCLGNPAHFQDWSSQFAEMAGVKISNLGAAQDRVRMTVEGPVQSVAVFAAKAIAPHQNIPVESVSTTGAD